MGCPAGGLGGSGTLDIGMKADWVWMGPQHLKDGKRNTDTFNGKGEEAEKKGRRKRWRRGLLFLREPSWEQPNTAGWPGASLERSRVGGLKSGLQLERSQGTPQNWLPSGPHWLPLKRGDLLGPEH